MKIWSTTFSYFAGVPDEVRTDDLDQWMSEFASERGVGQIEQEDFTDEVHFFFRDAAGKRRRLLCCQYEGDE